MPHCATRRLLAAWHLLTVTCQSTLRQLQWPGGGTAAGPQTGQVRLGSPEKLQAELAAVPGTKEQCWDGNPLKHAEAKVGGCASCLP